jgi:hypothetical protein
LARHLQTLTPVLEAAGRDARGGERLSSFRDLYSCQVIGDADARSRIDRHNLQTGAMGTTTAGPGFTTCKGCGAKL